MRDGLSRAAVRKVAMAGSSDAKAMSFPELQNLADVENNPVLFSMLTSTLLAGDSNTHFRTGSRVYGRPREDSDWDVMILLDDDEMKQVMRRVPSRIVHDYGQGTASLKIRCGMVLNLILTSCRKVFQAWLCSRNSLFQQKLNGLTPTRGECTECHDRWIAAMDWVNDPQSDSIYTFPYF